MISVALPVWNSRRIAWLSMESLCRQIKPSDKWELVIFKDGPDILGEEFFRSYEDRLSSVGCSRLNYIYSNARFSLPQKWVRIAKETNTESKAFIMCAADNYYHRWMLQDAENAIQQADWCIMPKGYFYDFSMDLVRFYHYNGIVGLTMVANTSMVRQFEISNLDRGVDGWFSQQMLKIAHDKGELLRCFMDGTEHYKEMLCTNGLNNISTGRIRFLKDVVHPFYETDTKLENIVPADICERLRFISQGFKPNDDLGNA